MAYKRLDNKDTMGREKVPDIVKKQRERGIGKLGLQKAVKEDNFEVEPDEASKLHIDLEKEHLDKMNGFDDVIDGFQKRMKKLNPSSKEYKRLHSICAVNRVEKERHRQHAESHRQCHEKHKKLAELYKKPGLPSDEEIEKIVNINTVEGSGNKEE
jgi:hypothetical protein